MKRFFVQARYDGTKYSGWQIQPNAESVQNVLEKTLSQTCREDIKITGCGRTDAGVHASFYVFHFDLSETMPLDFIRILNHSLPHDISIEGVYEVRQEAHARFDAHRRAYTYYLSTHRTSFMENRVSYYPYKNLDLVRLNEAASWLLKYSEFNPFCKTNSDVQNYSCLLSKSQWTEMAPGFFRYDVESNRFLRGMIRLIVGMCINYAVNKLSKEDVINALDNQTTINPSLSAPAEGLYLSRVEYPISIRKD